MKTKQTETCISVYSGDFFDYENPSSHEFDINDIAHSLSNLCRYCGHANKFYSVAEHSVIVSYLVPPELALVGLLHDASEAYCNDLPSPMKKLCPDYVALEESVQRAIAAYYDLPYPYPPEIKVADKLAYKTERDQICSVDDKIWFKNVKPLDNVTIMCYNPSSAKRVFLKRYKELTVTKESESNDRDGSVRREEQAEAA